MMVSFADRLLDWWQGHGRHDLPWQTERTPYRVWVSEIMLQQTQVATVIPYFERFVSTFPDLDALARADLDEVLSLWTGLGYYARARNLHAAAQICLQEYRGRLPSKADQLIALPGIGRSTAHAILAQALNQRAPILDGNVKRVVSRHQGIEGWPGQAAVIKRLWSEADRRTPADRAADYTQAIMDLGATVCRTRAPGCLTCPVNADCVAFQSDRIAEFPGKKPRKQRVLREAHFLALRNLDGGILLQRRPPSGIWGSLWCFPEMDQAPEQPAGKMLPTIESRKHEFTHFRLIMHFDHQVAESAHAIEEPANSRWFSLSKALQQGLPRPVQEVLRSLSEQEKD